MFEVGHRDNGRQAPVDQPRSYRSAGKAMDQNRPLIQGMHAVELEYFFLAFPVDALRGMQNERNVSSAFGEFAGQLRI